MDIQTLEPILRQHEALRDLRDEHVRFLTGCAKNVRYEPGAFLFREGDPADALVLVRSGRVAIETFVPGKGAILLEDAGEGDVIGWSWLFPPCRRSADARATELTLAVELDGACLRRKMDVDHDFGYAMAMLLLHKMHSRIDWVRLQWLDLYKAGA
ncbi:MAG TPA: cyclic nucleotide-binding domain-containing protein [Planctomycetota bacterium]|nr:cyclic nucleotide-binding domain-containing protein [Planctomycetota bacterium]